MEPRCDGGFEIGDVADAMDIAHKGGACVRLAGFEVGAQGNVDLGEGEVFVEYAFRYAPVGWMRLRR